MAQTIVVALFVVWFVLSVLSYIPVVGEAIRRFDWMMLIPTWKFFAPRPGQHDYHVLYQDRYADGTLTHWTEEEPAQVRPWSGAIWNPRKRANKALFDIVQEFAVHVRAGDRALEVSTSYLCLLNYVSSLPRSTSPHYTRFAIMYSQGNAISDDPEVYYVSRLHDL